MKKFLLAGAAAVSLLVAEPAGATKVWEVEPFWGGIYILTIDYNWCEMASWEPGYAGILSGALAAKANGLEVAIANNQQSDWGNYGVYGGVTCSYIQLQ